MDLSTLIANTFPSLTDDEAAAALVVADRRAACQAIVEAGVGGSLDGGATRLGAEAVTQASTYLAGDPGAQALDDLAHHVYNTLRGERPGADVQVSRAVDKITLLNTVPDMLTADIAWRVAAKTDDALAATLGYWDRADTLNASDPLSVQILDQLQTQAICSPDLRAALVAACMATIPGPVSSPLQDAGLTATAYEDVRATLAGMVS